MTRKKATGQLPTKVYEPSAEETAAIAAVRTKSKARTRAPRFKMEHDDKTQSLTVAFDHPDNFTAQCLAMLDMGTGDPRFFHSLTCQIATLGEAGKPNSGEAADFTLSVVRAVEPRDELEAMLAAQMAAVHQATMAMARRLNIAKTLPQQDAAERGLTKLARTYASQMEALKRYRSKGQQLVRVERVTVEDGGQAIVGNVETGGRGSREK